MLNTFVMVCHISIHALREEGDNYLFLLLVFDVLNFNPRPPRGGRLSPPFCFRMFHVISIHALREEGDMSFAISVVMAARFQSTPSARRATVLHQAAGGFQPHFNPRPPRGGRRGKERAKLALTRISIHALREEGDMPFKIIHPTRANFNPRPPRGGRPRSPAFVHVA